MAGVIFTFVLYVIATVAVVATAGALAVVLCWAFDDRAQPGKEGDQ